MKTIEVYSIASAHELVVRWLNRDGYPIMTEDDELTLEGEPVSIHIDGILHHRIHPRAPFKEQMAEEYANQIINGTDNSFDYTYHDRLFDWVSFSEDKINRINQIEEMIERLKNNNRTRRAVAIAWDPVDDTCAKNVPCLNWLQFVIRENKLCMHVLFRSNDMLSAFGQNAYGLTKLQMLVAEDLNIKTGYYEHVSMIPHIYPRRDESDLKKILGC